MFDTSSRVLSELHEVLDALEKEEFEGLGDGELLAQTRALLAVHSRVAAQLTRVVRRVDVRSAVEHDGARTTRSWLRGHLRASGTFATKLVAQGRALEQLPAVERAFAAGELGADHVEVIAKIVEPANREKAAEQGIDVGAVEAALVEVATRGTHRDLRSATEDYLAKLDPDGPEPDPTEERSVTLVQHPDGTWTIRGELDAVGGQKVATALESMSAAGRCAGDTRSRSQRTGDALVQLADLALASGQLPVLRTVKPHVIVTLGVEDLVDPSTGPGAARTGMGETISAARARWVACDASITRIVLDPDGLPLDVGREQRVVPPHIRKAVELRDEHCVFAGCEAPRWFCEKKDPCAPHHSHARGGTLHRGRLGDMRAAPREGALRLPRRARRHRPTRRALARLPPRRQRDRAPPPAARLIPRASRSPPPTTGRRGDRHARVPGAALPDELGAGVERCSRCPGAA